MRHRQKKYALNRFTSWHKATILSLVRNLFKYQSIKTTKTRAKACQPLVEKILTLAKANSLAGRRRAYKFLGQHSLVNLVFDEIAPRFKSRTSGFTRVVKLGSRRGDNAELVIFELMEIKAKLKRSKAEKQEKAEIRAGQEDKGPVAAEKSVEETRTKAKIAEKPPATKKPTKSFLGGIRNIFKKERDSL